MGVFDDIKLGLEQAIEYNKGNLAAKKNVRFVLPLPSFTPREIKQIRVNAKMTQALFAKYMGVSVKTVEAWECGKNQPVGAARRLLALTKENPSFPITSGIIGG